MLDERGGLSEENLRAFEIYRLAFCRAFSSRIHSSDTDQTLAEIEDSGCLVKLQAEAEGRYDQIDFPTTVENLVRGVYVDLPPVVARRVILSETAAIIDFRAKNRGEIVLAGDFFKISEKKQIAPTIFFYFDRGEYAVGRRDFDREWVHNKYIENAEWESHALSPELTRDFALLVTAVNSRAGSALVVYRP
ncbi:hypothetical protein HYU92_04815 [Candidatus Curtissbacteria bacterium]|nr:hypothetical protein [Candidatus Curtissbacteria bacterium]